MLGYVINCLIVSLYQVGLGTKTVRENRSQLNFTVLTVIEKSLPIKEGVPTGEVTYGSVSGGSSFPPKRFFPGRDLVLSGKFWTRPVTRPPSQIK